MTRYENIVNSFASRSPKSDDKIEKPDKKITPGKRRAVRKRKPEVDNQS